MIAVISMNKADVVMSPGPLAALTFATGGRVVAEAASPLSAFEAAAAERGAWSDWLGEPWIASARRSNNGSGGCYERCCMFTVYTG